MKSDYELLQDLVEQIAKCNPVDEHGHHMTTNQAHIAAVERVVDSAFAGVTKQGEKVTRLLVGRSDYHLVDMNGRIQEDEPVILFRAQDKHMLGILVHYREVLEHVNGDKPCLETIKNDIERVMAWQGKHDSKAPDVPEDAVQ